MGQPARNKAYRQVHFPKRKADPAESLSCARFAIVERPAATPHNPPEFQQLRDAVALMESSSKQGTRLINQLHGLLARVFPELAVSVKDLSANWVLSLLEKYPTPEQAWQELPDGPSKRLRTIPGIGLQTSAALVAKIVSIKRFATPTALIGYFGVFPEEVDVSGTDR